LSIILSSWKGEKILAIALPIAVDQRLVGTCFVGDVLNGHLLFITTLHHIGNGTTIQVAIPPHFGDVSISQTYPLTSTPLVDLELIYSDPIHDIAILKAKSKDIHAPLPNYLNKHNEINTGDDVVIVGYPYAPMGSVLETAEKSSVSAIGNRIFMDTIEVNEFVVSHQTYQGSSGSPVIRSSDGLLCGIVRGCLAPPEMLSIGNIPIGTDSNITYAVNASIIPNILENL